MEALKSYLTFKIGQEYFAANAAYIQNIIEIPKITEMPEMPAYMLGIINLRGKVLPVIDARVKFGMQKTALTTSSCIVVMEVEIKNQRVFMGMLVDAVDEVIEIEETAIKEIPTMGKQSINKAISGVYEYKDKFVLLLHMNNVMAQNEILAFDGLVPEKAEI